MALTTFPFADMSGPLTLVDQVSVLNPDTPIDVANVRAEMGGGISSRAGTAELGSRTPTARAKSLAFSTAGATDALLVQEDDLLVALDTAGLQIATQAVNGTEAGSWARFGGPNAERVWYADGIDLAYFDGSAFTLNPAGLPRPRAVCVAPWDNRLFAIGYTAAAKGPAASLSSPSHLHYSAAGDPATWTATQRIVLYPGDGESLVAGVTWRDRTFVFKQSRFFVIYGTVDTGGGVPDLQWYTVDTKVGVDGANAVCAGRDAVYFVTNTGVYATTGDDPVLISQGLDPMFHGTTATYFTGELADPGAFGEACIEWYDERLYVGLRLLNGQYRTLVYDPRTQWWGYDTLDLGCVVRGILGGRPALFYGPSSGVVRYFRDDIVGDTVAGVTSPVVARWRSGWHDFGSPDVKNLRHSRALGSGQVGLSYSVDGMTLRFGGTFHMDNATDEWADGSDPTDLWRVGESPTDMWGQGVRYAEDWVRRVPVRGRRYSWELRGTGQWSVQQLDHHLHQPPRRPAVDLTANAST